MTIFRSLGDAHELVDSFTRPVRTMLPVSRFRDDPDGEQNRWQAIVELGWLGISVPEEAGGIGLSAIEEVLAAQSFGRQLISTNYPATVIAAHAFHKAGDDDTVQALLAGEARAAFALQGNAPGARSAIDAEGATYLVALTGKGIEICTSGSLEIDDDVHWGRTIFSTPANEPLLLDASPDTAIRSRLLIAALLAGIATECCERGVEYAKVREQFGQPIGAFQAVKHHCADMAIMAHAAKELTTSAALAFTEGHAEAGREADAALNLALRAARHNAGKNIQVHGGMGFSAECDAHLYLKAARLLDAACGGLSENRRRLISYS